MRPAAFPSRGTMAKKAKKKKKKTKKGKGKTGMC